MKICRSAIFLKCVETAAKVTYNNKKLFLKNYFTFSFQTYKKELFTF